MYYKMRVSKKKFFFIALVLIALLLDAVFCMVYYHNSVNPDLAGHFLSSLHCVGRAFLNSQGI